MMPTEEDVRSLGDFAPIYKWELTFLEGPFVTNDINGLNFRCVSATLPKKTFDEITVGIHGQDKYVCGRVKYNTITLDFVETIDNFIALFLYNLHEAQWQTNTGIQAPQAQVEFTCMLTRMNRQNQPTFAYQLVGCWIQDYSHSANPLQADTSDVIKPTLTIRYDYFIEGPAGSAFGVANSAGVNVGVSGSASGGS